MIESPIPYTIQIFDELCRHLPPLVPQKVATDMVAASVQIKNDPSLTVTAVEDALIAFGKKIWPYRKAFEEFLELYEGKLGESLLIVQLSSTLKRRYHEFVVCGGTYRDLHGGRPALFFSSAERTELCAALIAVSDAVRAHTIQAVFGIERQQYEERIREFTSILEGIEDQLQLLRKMAEDEQEHPSLAAEIRAQIRSFEYGLCLLGPRHSYEAVCQAPEHFVGRKKEKEMHAHR